MISNTQLQGYGEFFYAMLRKFANQNCKHCYGRGYEGVQVGTAQSKGKKQATGWEIFCNARGCVGKNLARYHDKLNKAKANAQRAKEVVK